MRTLCTLLALTLIASFATAQEQQQPGEEHELLTKSVGDRSGVMTIWVAGPEADPISVPFKETNKAILNGFFVETDFEAGPYKGRGLSGYDPKKKKYVGTWASNMTPHLAVMVGEYDKETHTLTHMFKDIDPETGKLVEMKSVTSMVPGKPETMTMYQKDAKSGEFVKTFVMKYATNE